MIHETVQTGELEITYGLPDKEVWTRTDVAELVAKVAESAFAQGMEYALQKQREAMSHTFN